MYIMDERSLIDLLSGVKAVIDFNLLDATLENPITGWLRSLL